MEHQVYVSSTNSYEFKIISWASFHHVITYISLCLLVQGVALRLWAVLSLADTYWNIEIVLFFFFLIINTDSNTIKFLVYPCPKIQSWHCLPLPIPVCHQVPVLSLNVSRSQLCPSLHPKTSTLFNWRSNNRSSKHSPFAGLLSPQLCLQRSKSYDLYIKSLQ